MTTSEEWTRGWISTHHPTQPGFDDKGEPVSAVDWLGNRFYVGENVIYCIAAGRGQMMAIGKVLKIKAEVESRRYGRAPEPGETPDRDGTVADFLPYYDVTVLVLTEKTSGRWDNKARNRGAWVKPMNITSLTGLPPSVPALPADQMEAAP